MLTTLEPTGFPASQASKRQSAEIQGRSQATSLLWSRWKRAFGCFVCKKTSSQPAGSQTSRLGTVTAR